MIVHPSEIISPDNLAAVAGGSLHSWVAARYLGGAKDGSLPSNNAQLGTSGFLKDMVAARGTYSSTFSEAGAYYRNDTGYSSILVDSNGSRVGTTGTAFNAGTWTSMLVGCRLLLSSSSPSNSAEAMLIFWQINSGLTSSSAVNFSIRPIASVGGFTHYFLVIRNNASVLFTVPFKLRQGVLTTLVCKISFIEGVAEVYVDGGKVGSVNLTGSTFLSVASTQLILGRFTGAATDNIRYVEYFIHRDGGGYNETNINKITNYLNSFPQ